MENSRTPQWLSGDLVTRWLVSVLAIPLAVFGTHMPLWQLAVGLGVYVGYTLFLTAYARKHTDLRRLRPVNITLDVLLVSAFVYLKGGLRSDIYHFYYMAIVLAGIRYGMWEGLVTALASGVLYFGAVSLAQPGDPVMGRVLVRTIYFIVMGFVSAYVASEVRRERLARAEKEQLLAELSEAHEQLQEYAREKGRQAVTDGLTGLFNHTYLQERLEEELRRAERYGHKVSLVMLDLDRFKAYNDAWGHLQGNGVLRQVADTLRGAVRASDLVARYGGDEFAVILPETDTEEALAMAERIRQQVDGLSIEVRPGDSITASLGVATFPQHGRSRVELVDRADQALYQVKRQGRNRVVAWSA